MDIFVLIVSRQVSPAACQLALDAVHDSNCGIASSLVLTACGRKCHWAVLFLVVSQQQPCLILSEQCYKQKSLVYCTHPSGWVQEVDATTVGSSSIKTPCNHKMLNPGQQQYQGQGMQGAA